MRSSFRKIVPALLFTAAVMQGAAVVIKTAPPAPMSVTVVGRAPSARHIWIPGYYKGVGSRYVWVAGKWIVPPRPGAVWVPPMWRQGPNGYVFVAGHWR